MKSRITLLFLIVLALASVASAQYYVWPNHQLRVFSSRADMDTEYATLTDAQKRHADVGPLMTYSTSPYMNPEGVSYAILLTPGIYEADGCDSAYAGATPSTLFAPNQTQWAIAEYTTISARDTAYNALNTGQKATAKRWMTNGVQSGTQTYVLAYQNYAGLFYP